MSDRDLKPENERHEIPWLGNINHRRVNEEHELERFELAKEEGRIRFGRRVR